MRTFILQRFFVYGRVCLIFALAASPVVFNRKTQDVFNLLKFGVLWAAGWAGLMLFIIWTAERGVRLPRAHLLLASFGFLLACVIATAFSNNPLLSLFGLYHRYGGLISFVLYVAIMLAIIGLYWESPWDLKDLAKGASFAFVALTAYVLIQEAGQDWIAWKDSSGGPPPYPVGTMGNSNFAGGYLGIAVPFVLHIALTAKKDWARTSMYVVTGLGLLALWFTQTRGGMIAGAAGLVMMGFLHRQRLPKWMKVASVSLIATGLVVSALVLFSPGSDEPPGPLAEIETLRTGTFEVRTYYWATALRIFKESPLTGVGLDLYYANYPKHRLPADGAQLGLTITDKPHNVFLEYLANGGILTFGAYLAVVGLALTYGLRRMKTIEEPLRGLLAVFISVLAGYLAQGAFSIDVPPLAVMGWVGVAGIAAIADPGLERARSVVQGRAPRGKGSKKANASSGRFRVERHGSTNYAVHVPVAIVTVILVVLGARPILADAAVKKATSLASQGDAAGVLDAYAKAVKLNPWEASYRSQAGAHHETAGTKAEEPGAKVAEFKQAESFYRQALDLQPGNIFYMLNLARLYTAWAEVDKGYFPRADDWWGKVVDHDPTDWDVHSRYALMLNSYANARGGDMRLRERTLSQLKKTVSIRRDHVASWINIAKVEIAIGRKEPARAALQEALEIDPRNEEASKILQSIEQR